MDDELEKLLAELAEQERERLRRKSGQQNNFVPNISSSCVNKDNSLYWAPGYAGVHSLEMKAPQIQFSTQNEQTVGIPLTTQHSKKQQHGYLSSTRSNYHYATLMRPGGFQIFSGYSQLSSNLKDANIKSESNFVNQVREMDRLHFDYDWTKFR